MGLECFLSSVAQTLCGTGRMRHLDQSWGDRWVVKQCVQMTALLTTKSGEYSAMDNFIVHGLIKKIMEGLWKNKQWQSAVPAEFTKVECPCRKTLFFFPFWFENINHGKWFSDILCHNLVILDARFAWICLTIREFGLPSQDSFVSWSACPMNYAFWSSPFFQHFKKDLLLYVWSCFAWMYIYICIMCMPGTHKDQKRELYTLVMDGCELQC